MAKAKKKPTIEKSEPKYPYTSSPSELKRLLQTIPQKPKPPKLTPSTAKTWGIKNNNVGKTISVLRELGLVESNGTPTSDYAAYMTANTGGLALGQKIKERYSELFSLLKDPPNATNDELKNFFNIHSGGAEATIDYQVKTFKALCEFASFDGTYIPSTSSSTTTTKHGTAPNGTQIHFDLHIHLPEGKNHSEYESIIKAISEHIIAKINGK